VKKILVCRIGAFGDVCMALPVVQALTEHYEVHWLIRRGHDAVLPLFPVVRCRPVVFASAASRDLAELSARLAGERYDALLDFSNWRVVARLAERLKEIPVRAIAYDRTHRFVLQRIRNALPWLRPFNQVVELGDAVHRVTKWQQLVKHALGPELSLGWPLAPVKLPDGALRVFLHPHASKPDKVWPIERFAAVVARLGERMPTTRLVNHGRARKQEAAEKLVERLRAGGSEASLVPFDPSLFGLRHALETVHVAFGSDSGPVHLASLLGVPTVVLYGPASPAEVAPLWRTVAVEARGRRAVVSAITPAMAMDGVSRLFDLFFDRREPSSSAH
jgi:ADP-heptose:LPS heptosyltransferase